MQSSLGPRPIRPLSRRSPTLIGGLSAFCINSQIIRLQHSLFSSSQSFSLSLRFHSSCSVIPPSLHFCLGFLHLCHKLQFLCYSHPPSLPPTSPLLLLPLTISSDSFFSRVSTLLLPLSLFSFLLRNDRFCVIVCLSVNRLHHPV